LSAFDSGAGTAVAAAPPAGRESPFFARLVSEPGAALAAECKFAIFARGTSAGCVKGLSGAVNEI